MPINTAFDALEFDNLDLPYNKYPKELSEEPRFVAGLNGVTTLGGKVMKRGGTIRLGQDSGTTYGRINGRIDRIWAYENLSGTVYLVISVNGLSGGTGGGFLTDVYSLYYSPIDNISWTIFPSVRGCNNATAAHNAAFSRGIMYIRCLNTSDTEKLGTITFNTNSGSPVVSKWGILPPTVPAAIVGAVNRINMAAGLTASGTALTVATNYATAGFPAAPFNIQIDYETLTVSSIGGGTNWTVTRAQNGTVAAAHTNTSLIAWLNWTASTHPVVVNFGWLYSYALVNLNGQISSRAPVETNPDNKPSSTGPFINLRPKITVQGNADTTNYPSIAIFRTTDGGGTFYFLETITNTGAGNITYEDKSLVSATTLTDPLPDNVLDGNAIAPTLTSNSPPPSVVAPGVIGTTAMQGATPIAVFQGRFWIGLANIVFYSGGEEISYGIPEESFPSGAFGNFFRFTEPIVNIVATTYSLYVFTSKRVYTITGSNRETFTVRLLLGHVGMANSFSQNAATAYRDSVVWLTNDYRVAIVQGKLSSLQSDYYNVISDPLYDDILLQKLNGAGEILSWDIKYWSNQEKEYIIVMANSRSSPYGASTNAIGSKQWIYEVKKSAVTQKDFWLVPWKLPITACLTSTGISNVIKPPRPLVFAMWDYAAATAPYTGNSLLVYWDETGTTTSQDVSGNSTSLDYAFQVRSNLLSHPAGNHLNALRKPAMSTTVDHMIVDRTSFAGDSDPDVKYYTDDIWTTPQLTPVPELPERRQQSKGYTTHIYPINTACRRFGWEINKSASGERFELQSLAVVFNSDAGA